MANSSFLSVLGIIFFLNSLALLSSSACPTCSTPTHNRHHHHTHSPPNRSDRQPKPPSFFPKTPTAENPPPNFPSSPVKPPVMPKSRPDHPPPPPKLPSFTPKPPVVQDPPPKHRSPSETPCSPPPPPVPDPSFPLLPSPPKYETCPANTDTLKIGACVDVLHGLVHIGLGNDPQKDACCPVLSGLLDLDAAVCLCTTIRAKLLNIAVVIPIALQVLIDCGKTPPPGFNCAA